MGERDGSQVRLGVFAGAPGWIGIPFTGERKTRIRNSLGRGEVV